MRRLLLPAAAALLPAAAALLLAAPPPAAAQSSTVGGHAGSVRSVQRRSTADDSERYGGLLVGAWLDVVTPAPWLSVLAEASFTRRGGEYDLDARLEDAPVRVDYLTLAVLPTLRLGIGPASLLGYAGPSVDLNLRTRTVAELGSAFLDSAPQVFSVAAGGGVEGRRGRISVRLEGRIHEQVGDAFRGGAAGLKHRSTELLLRVGVRPTR